MESLPRKGHSICAAMARSSESNDTDAHDVAVESVLSYGLNPKERQIKIKSNTEDIFNHLKMNSMIPNFEGIGDTLNSKQRAQQYIRKEYNSLNIRKH
jgi:hypothetical protein